jgi:hypothetical protein
MENEDTLSSRTKRVREELQWMRVQQIFEVTEMIKGWHKRA